MLRLPQSWLVLLLFFPCQGAILDFPDTPTDHAIFAINEERTATVFRTVKHPTAVQYLAYDGSLLVSSFMTNQVVRVEWEPPLHVLNVSVFAAGKGLDGPWGLACSQDHVYIASFATDEIHKYSPQGAYLTSFGGEHWLDGPEGMVLSRDESTLYVASFINDQIVAFTTDGNPLAVVATSRDGLAGPEHITREASTQWLYVANHFKDVVTVIDPTQPRVWTLTSVPKPVGLTFGLDGLLYTTSYTTNSIVRLNTTSAQVVDTFASGNNLAGPSAIVFAGPRLLLIACYDSHQILAFNSTSGLTFTVYKNSRTKA
eukprot:TRINITY_DN8473_c0_g1_i2.p1 TRINITY_DN8473_c0_g1~~TRINITY_DN8473_c0_g1_i2.p1  ORF type:complete len:314 (+),score=46.27 TRINITY_DN8473_c0_g1_i2:78-1019(+)